MSTVDSLFVLWLDEQTARRWIIGRLSRTDDGQFSFSYDAQAVDAAKVGFRPLPEFPDLRMRYASPYLFSTFSQRIPSPRRPDYPRLLQKWDVRDATDLLAILAKSGGLQMTDRLELAEYRPEEDVLDRPLEFRVAGRRYTSKTVSLVEGTRLTLKRDSANEHDPCAIQVLAHDGTIVGYVPRQYSSMIAKHLDAGRGLQCHVVRQLRVPDGRDGAVVRVELAEAASALRPAQAKDSAA